MKRNIYTVHAYRWGDRELHSYSVGVYSQKHAALKAAKAESQWRGGKYECEVLEWVPDGKNEDGSPGMPYKIIQPLPHGRKKPLKDIPGFEGTIEALEKLGT